MLRSGSLHLSVLTHHLAQFNSGLVRKQATILAMQDAFRISLVLTLLGIVAAFFVRTKRAIAPPTITPEQQLLSQQEREEAEAARQEATLAV